MMGGKVGYVREPSVITREHPNSLSARAMSEDRIHYAEWLVLLARHGAAAMGAAEAARVTREVKRNYFRRMLRWRFVDRAIERVRKHEARLRLAGSVPTILDYADALIDWPMRKLGLRAGKSLFRY
jgi:hypothetical protein